MLDATNGNLLGTFPSFLLAPAFSGSIGYFVGRATLTARDATSLLPKWTFKGDSGIVTAPIVVNGHVYVSSHEGTLYALNASTGAMVWSTSLGKKLFEPDEENAMLMTGLPPPMVCSSDPRNTRFLRMRRPHHLLRFNC